MYCDSLNSKDEPCGNHVRPGKKYCRFHGPDNGPKRSKASRKDAVPKTPKASRKYTVPTMPKTPTKTSAARTSPNRHRHRVTTPKASKVPEEYETTKATQATKATKAPKASSRATAEYTAPKVVAVPMTTGQQAVEIQKMVCTDKTQNPSKYPIVNEVVVAVYRRLFPTASMRRS